MLRGLALALPFVLTNKRTNAQGREEHEREEGGRTYLLPQVGRHLPIRALGLLSLARALVLLSPVILSLAIVAGVRDLPTLIGGLGIEPDFLGHPGNFNFDVEAVVASQGPPLEGLSGGLVVKYCHVGASARAGSALAHALADNLRKKRKMRGGEKKEKERR